MGGSKRPGDGDGGITSLLSQLLKHSLPMLDSTSEPVQKVGVAALHALVEGVTPTQLRWYGEVVLDVLAKAQRSVSPHVRQTLDPLIVQCVRVIEHPPGKHHASILDFFIRQLSYSSVDFRCAKDARQSPYALFLSNALEPLLRSMSLLTVAHLPALFDIFFRDCLDPATPYEVVAAILATLSRLCKFCWPRAPAHQKKLCILAVQCYMKPALLSDSDHSVPKTMVRVQQASVQLLKTLVVCARLVNTGTSSTVLESIVEASQRLPLLRPLRMQLQEAL